MFNGSRSVRLQYNFCFHISPATDYYSDICLFYAFTSFASISHGCSTHSHFGKHVLYNCEAQFFYVNSIQRGLFLLEL